MKVRLAVLALTAATAAVPLPAATASPFAKGATCALATVRAGSSLNMTPLYAGVVAGGPVVVVESSTSVTYTCVVEVVRGGTVVMSVPHSFAGPAAVGVLPPHPVAFAANPATDEVRVCTWVDWIWPFPSGGGADLGCQTATYATDPVEGFTAVPELSL